MERQTEELALALKVVGLMNVQFAIKDDEIYVLEVNPRASRTVPFVAKVIGLPIAGIAAEVMAGKTLASFGLKRPHLDHIAVKEAVFPFARFPGVDTVLGPEMRSTGEVMGIDRDYAVAFAKSQIGGGSKLPLTGTVFVSVKDSDKDKIMPPIRELAAMGFRIIATRGTKRHLDAHGIECERSTRCWRAARISSTPSPMARSTSSSTPPKGRRRWPIPSRSAARPCSTTSLIIQPLLVLLP